MAEGSTSYHDVLPGVLAEMAEAAGLDAALKVAESVGGTRAWIARRPPADGWLADLIGLRRAEAIGAHLAPGDDGVLLDIPLGPTGARARSWRRMREMIDAGCSKRQIAKALGIAARTVQRHRNGQSGQPKADPNQGDLF